MVTRFSVRAVEGIPIVRQKMDPDDRKRRTRKDTDNDRKEVTRLTAHYREYLWADHGILHDLEQEFKIRCPCMAILRQIAVLLGKVIGIEPGRQERRRREFCIGWLNEHYDAIREYIPRLVINDGEFEVGPHLRDWRQFKEDNPDSDALRFLDARTDSAQPHG
jgi:hypothetical protein